MNIYVYFANLIKRQDDGNSTIYTILGTTFAGSEEKVDEDIQAQVADHFEGAGFEILAKEITELDKSHIENLLMSRAKDNDCVDEVEAILKKLL